MPNLNKAEEKLWNESKGVVRKEKAKPQKKFKDRDWALVQKIFGLKKKKHLGKGKKKRAAVNVTVEPAEPLIDKAVALIESKSPGYLANAGVTHVVVESGDPGHFGKAESDKPDTIFIAADKIKSMIGSSPDNEEAVVRQIAVTIAHECGHQKSKFQGGESPAEAEEKQMESKLSQIQNRTRVRKLAAVDPTDPILQPSFELPEEARAELERRIRQLWAQVLANQAMLREMEESPESFPHLVGRLEGEIAKRKKLLMEKTKLFNEEQSHYQKLSGKPADISGITEPKMPARVKRKSSDKPAIEAPVKPTAEEKMATEIERLKVENEAVRESTLMQNTSESAEEASEEPINQEDVDADDLEDEKKFSIGNILRRTFSGLPESQHGFAQKLVEYMILQKKDGDFISGTDSFDSLQGEKANKKIQDEIARSSGNLNHYLSALERDYAELVHAKKTGAYSRQAAYVRNQIIEAIDSLKEKREKNSRALRRANNKEEQDKVMKEGMEIRENLSKLEQHLQMKNKRLAVLDKVREDRHNIERLIEKSIQNLLWKPQSVAEQKAGVVKASRMVPGSSIFMTKRPGEPGFKPELAGPSERGLGAMEQQLRREREKQEIQRYDPFRQSQPLSVQVPAPVYHGLERHHELMQMEPERPSVLEPKPRPNAQQTEEDATRSQWQLPATPGSEVGKVSPSNIPHQRRPGFKPLRKRRSGLKIPLLKIAVKSKLWEQKMLEQADPVIPLPTTEINRNRIPEKYQPNRGPVATPSASIEKVLRHNIRDLVRMQRDPSTGIGGETNLVQRLEYVRRAREIEQEYLDKLVVARKQWAEALKELKNNKMNKEERAEIQDTIKELKSKIVEVSDAIIPLTIEINHIEARLRLTSSFLEERKMGLPTADTDTLKRRPMFSERPQPAPSTSKEKQKKKEEKKREKAVREKELEELHKGRGYAPPRWLGGDVPATKSTNPTQELFDVLKKSPEAADKYFAEFKERSQKEYETRQRELEDRRRALKSTIPAPIELPPLSLSKNEEK